YQVGDQNFIAGAKTILTKNTEILAAIGAVTDGIPFSVLFSGMLLHNLFFWSTNQFIIHRALGARRLEEGQKGVMIASFFKILNIFYIAMPGVIALHLYGPGPFENPDWVYPALISDIMPTFMVGFFAAVIFGTVLSTFNSVLNSSVTFFALDIYKPLFVKDLDDDTIIERSKKIGVAMAVITMIIAPFIMYFPEGIFTFMVKVDSLFGAPILMVLLLGDFSSKTPPFAANLCLGLFLAAYGAFMFFIPLDMHYLHYMTIVFLVFISLALLIGCIKPETKPDFRKAGSGGVDVTPWKHFKTISIAATLVMIGAYILLSPVGLVDAEREKTIEYGYIVMGIIIAFVVLILPIIRLRRQAAA
ncbi:MAG: hypothetical protein MKZ70_11270, partial [Opitutales bacterium]|nr:hypothetical protein [Opitutales bacterium]